MTTVVYTDGACSGNPGPGGWAWAVPDGPFAAGAEAKSTNQRMEVMAVLEALRAIDGPVEVRSDSAYVVNCFRDRWWEGWLRKGWLNSQRKPVANRDLWEPLIDLYRTREPRPRFTWVKGHSGDVMNDLVDALAVEAAKTQAPRSGTGPPSVTPAATAAGGRDARLPRGWLVLVTGHRPPELGGYGPNPVAERVRAKLAEILGAKRELHPDLVVVTGLQLGAEQLAAEAGQPYVAVLPFPDPDKVWPAAARRHFAELVDDAVATVVLERVTPDSKQKVAGALARRDAWLVRNVDEAIVVWDRDNPVLGRLVRSLQDHLGEEDVWILAP